MKGIVFAGCSFTWGEGLELYSNFPSVNYDYFKRSGYYFPNEGYFMPKSHKKYIESNRFSRLVANHFGTFEVVAEKNGGNIYTMKDHIQKSIIDYKDDIEYVIVQLTESRRAIKMHQNCNGECCKEDLVRMIENYYHYKTQEEGDEHIHHANYIISTYLNENEIESHLYNREVEENIEFFRFLMGLKNVKVRFLGSWMDSHNIFDLKNNRNLYESEYNFYKENLIPILYHDKRYKTICDFLSENEKDFVIYNEFKWSNNWHPNLKFQKVAANSIIEYIENERN